MNSLSPEAFANAKARLGLDTISVDQTGLRQAYRAWCLNVPFDNLRKMSTAFRDPTGPLPPLNADCFFDSWTRHGVGATCWPHAEAIYSFFTSLGFDARRAAGSMYDMGDPNHGTTLVRLDDGSTWLLDNALLTLEPLCIDAESPSSLDNPVHFAEVEVDGDNVFVYGTHPPMPNIFFRLVERDVSRATYEARWAAARSTGPFNERAHIRRNWPDRIETLRGGALFTLDANGLSTTPLDADSLLGHMRDGMGVDPAFVREWSTSGALESTLKPAGQPPNLPLRLAPSKR